MSEENKNLDENMESNETEAPTETEEITEVSEAETQTEETAVGEISETEAVDEIPETEAADAIPATEAVDAAEELTETAEVSEEVQGNNKKTVMAVVIGVAVLVVAAIIVVFAVFGKTWFNPYNRGHVDITGRTVGEVADMMGMEYDEFLEAYGLPEDMPKSTIESAASYNISLSKYAENSGMELSDLAEYLGWDESITGDENMTIGKALDQTKLSAYVGEEGLASFKEEYGLGDDVTGDTLWGDVRKTVELQQKAEYEKQRAEAEEEAAADNEAADDTEDTDAADEPAGDTATEETVTAAPAE